MSNPCPRNDETLRAPVAAATPVAGVVTFGGSGSARGGTRSRPAGAPVSSGPSPRTVSQQAAIDAGRHDYRCWEFHDVCALRAAFDVHLLQALRLADMAGPSAWAVLEQRRRAARFADGLGPARRGVADPALVAAAREALAAHHEEWRARGVALSHARRRAVAS